MELDHSLIGHASRRAASESSRAEALGFDGVWATESVTDVFVQSMAAVLSTERVSVGTAIAVAFSRNPMTVAYASWDLAAASEGRFLLGLGTQVEAHIERRFSMPWSSPVPRLRDFIAALRAIWHAWRTGGRLKYEGEFYRHTLMSPVFSPPAHDLEIPVLISAVGPRMSELAGELCDGAILHGMTNTAYLDTVTRPAIERGLATSGRRRDALSLSCPLFMVMGDTDADLERERARARDQIAFYASTPAYRPVLEAVGYGDLQPELQQLTRQGRWVEMGALIDDELYGEIVLEGAPEDMAHLAHARFGGRLDRVSSYFGWPTDDPDRIGAIIAAFHEGATS